MTCVSFTRIEGRWAIARLDAGAALPEWLARAHLPFVAITRTRAETSIVCAEDAVPADVTAERDWALIELLGPFALSTTGILAAFAQPLAEAGIPLFAISSFDTDHLLVPATRIDAACRVLVGAGHRQRQA
jgi:hypothetical protein